MAKKIISKLSKREDIGTTKGSNKIKKIKNKVKSVEVDKINLFLKNDNKHELATTKQNKKSNEKLKKKNGKSKTNPAITTPEKIKAKNKIKKKKNNKVFPMVNKSLEEIPKEKQNSPSKTDKKREKFNSQLKNIIKDYEIKESIVKEKKKPVLTLREKMMKRLKSARFRFLNEQIYTVTGYEAQQIFKSNPDAFDAYHEGYRQQVKVWPLNPLNEIINSINKMPKDYVIADLGCGDALLAQSVKQKVYSFDLVAKNERVTACDMAKLPLEKDSVDVVVFCLSLMGTNLNDYILEANRILKIGGILKIAEVESRFENVDNFIKDIRKFNFQNLKTDLSHELFYFMDFKKLQNIKNKKNLSILTLQPCLYKKR